MVRNVVKKNFSGCIDILNNKHIYGKLTETIDRQIRIQTETHID